jgi:uncharacterized glyoxalase superfamily protein PhnB
MSLGQAGSILYKTRRDRIDFNGVKHLSTHASGEKMKVDPVPKDFHTLTPYLSAPGASRLLEFMQAAFNAEINECHRTPDGTIMNAELTIGTSKLMMGESQGDKSRFPAMLYMYVEDADATFKNAVQAGARIVVDLSDMFYGDRVGAVEDMAGNQWWIATRKENVNAAEIAERAASLKR